MDPDSLTMLMFLNLAILMESVREWNSGPMMKPLVMYKLGLPGMLIETYCYAAAALGTVSALVWGLMNATWYVVIGSFFGGVLLHRLTLYRFLYWRAFVTSILGAPLFATFAWWLLWFSWFGAA